MYLIEIIHSVWCCNERSRSWSGTFHSQCLPFCFMFSKEATKSDSEPGKVEGAPREGSWLPNVCCWCCCWADGDADAIRWGGTPIADKVDTCWSGNWETLTPGGKTVCDAATGGIGEDVEEVLFACCSCCGNGDGMDVCCGWAIDAGSCRSTICDAFGGWDSFTWLPW